MTNVKEPLPKLCPLCGEASLFDDVTEFYYCGHCDQFTRWLPDNYTALLTGPPGAGKTPALHNWIDFYLRNDRPIILLAFDDAPSNLRHPLGNYTQDKLREHESKGTATLVDCYSSLAGMPSQEKYALKNRIDLNEISLLITDLLNTMSQMKSPKVIMDSATPLFTYKDPQLVVQFLSSMAVKVKSKGAALVIALTTGTVNEEIIRRLQTLVDFAVEMRIIEVDGRPKRQMRIAKARGQRVPYEEWIPLYIGTKAVSIDVGNEPSKYERLRKALLSKPP